MSTYNISANDLVYSSKDDLLYALVSGMDIKYGNCLIALNPNTGEVLKSVFIGSDPKRIKLTSDKKYAYVSFSSIGYIKRINLSLFVVDKSISLGQNLDDNADVHSVTAYAMDFEVLPESDDEIVVARTPNFDRNEAFYDLVLYQDGKIAPKKISPYNGIMWTPITQIISDRTGKILFGCNSQSEDYSYYISVVDSGLVMKEVINDPYLKTYGKLKSKGDTIYTSVGQVIDAFSKSLNFLGYCPIDDFICYDQYSFTLSERYKAYIFPNYQGQNLYLNFFDCDNYSLKRKIEIDVPEDLRTYTYSILSMEETNDGKLCFITSDRFKYKVIMILDIYSEQSYYDSIPQLDYSNKIKYPLLNIKALDIIHNPKKEKIYGVISPKDPVYGNCLISFNPLSQQVESSLFLGDVPYIIKLTDDLNYAYVAFRNTNFLKRINLNSFLVDKEIELNSKDYNKLYANDFAILPNSIDDIVISRVNNCGPGGWFVDLVLYINNIIQPKSLSNMTTTISQIISDSTGKTIFGYNSSNSGFDCYTIDVVDSGLTLKNTYNNLVAWSYDMFFPKILADKNRIMASNGRIVDAFSNQPEILGQCFVDTDSPGYLGRFYNFIPSDYLNAYIYASLGEGSFLYLNLFNRDTYANLGTVLLDSYNPFVYIRKIQVIDKYHLAFILTNNMDDVFFDNNDERLALVDLSQSFVSIPEIETKPVNKTSEIYIFPNPTNDLLYISDIENVKKYSILSLDGKKAKQDVFVQGQSLNISDLNKGIYLVQIYFNDNSIITKKVCKN